MPTRNHDMPPFGGLVMACRLLTLAGLVALIGGGALAADNSTGAAPAIGPIDQQGAQSVCAAWAQSAPRSAGLVWIGLPAAVKPFGMRAYVGIDGITRPLRQIAYAHTAGDLAIHYRTLGERPYAVRLELSGIRPGGLEGAGLTGTLIVSRFGLFTEMNLTGSCGASPR
jgi:hypothetical protein